LVQEWYTTRYHLTEKQWKAKKVSADKGFPMAPLPGDTFDEKGRRIRWLKKPPKGG